MFFISVRFTTSLFENVFFFKETFPSGFDHFFFCLPGSAWIGSSRKWCRALDKEWWIMRYGAVGRVMIMG